jgi:hypothetical protein
MSPNRRTPSHPIIEYREIENGYQLCRSCGNELLTGDRAAVVDLGAGILEYVHPKCLKVYMPPRWNKAIRVHDSRSVKNDGEAQFMGSGNLCGFQLPLMTVIDDSQTQAELSLVTRSMREVTQASSPLKFRNGEEDGPKELIADKGQRRNGTVLVNPTNWSGDGSEVVKMSPAERREQLQIEHEVIWEERKKTYATGRVVDISDEGVGSCITFWDDKRTRYSFDRKKPKCRLHDENPTVGDSNNDMTGT